MGFFSRRAVEDLQVIFFATDVHGSERCFRKFLNAGRLYGASILILGGDMLGKHLVPIVERADGRFTASYADKVLEAEEDGLGEIRAMMRDRGDYPVVGTEDELAQLEDGEHRERVFRKLAYDVVADWVSLAEDRLRGTGIRCFMAPGNDDFMEIDGALQGSDVVEFAENKCIAIGRGREMITTGYSNRTPWNTERELSESELKRRIQQMAAQAEDPENLIAVLHAPPYNSHLDLAPELTDELRVVSHGGQVSYTPVGSTAVREFIEHSQPLLGLHGHVHEGGGAVQLGRTLCVNPGSEYTQGILSGAIVRLSNGGQPACQFVSG
jgi:uncharacterized protein